MVNNTPEITIEPVDNTDSLALMQLRAKVFGPDIDNVFISPPDGFWSALESEDAITWPLESGNTKACLSNGEIVGYACWEFYDQPGGMPFKSYEESPEFTDSENACYRELHDMKMMNMAGRKCVVLDEVAVHLAWQGLGIGTLLLREGIKKADELKLPIWLNAIGEAKSLYTRQGFENVKEIKIDKQEFDEEGFGVTICMLREAREESAGHVEDSGNEKDADESEIKKDIDDSESKKSADGCAEDTDGFDSKDDAKDFEIKKNI